MITSPKHTFNFFQITHSQIIVEYVWIRDQQIIIFTLVYSYHVYYGWLAPLPPQWLLLYLRTYLAIPNIILKYLNCRKRDILLFAWKVKRERQGCASQRTPEDLCIIVTGNLRWPSQTLIVILGQSMMLYWSDGESDIVVRSVGFYTVSHRPIISLSSN